MTKIKNSSLFIGMFLSVIACNPTTENTTTETVDNEPKVAVVQEKPEPVALAFTGTIVVDKEKESITAIQIKKEGSTTVFQTIENLELPYQEDHPACEKPVFEDLNFDGIPDMRMPESMGMVNFYYAYWIYNPESQKFEKDQTMNLCSPVVDVETKEIRSVERASAASYTETIYEVQEGTFVHTKTENRTYTSEDAYQYEVYERQADGTMKKVKDEVVEAKE